ncbi:S8 family peptidase (plasmid) [Streptomyces sp. BI20]|uniref:S8 family peptidase n=1 Tax=Streptomyces sp. BI20 TaxID=3403460 RepID=UPI003C70E032
MSARTPAPRRATGARALAGAVVVALGTGLTAPVAAAPAAGAPAARAQAAPVTVTLITGDRVTVNADGDVIRFERAKGRERVPVRTQRVDGHTLVLPADVRELVDEGTLDRRLFDVTTLADPALRALHGDRLGLIVQYRGPAADEARARLRAAGDTPAAPAARDLPTLDADAVAASPERAAAVWEALTDRRARGARAGGSGIAKVWLDGVRKATLDKSVRQIGADKAWQAGLDGTGVKIAVLDTGVDETHPDLKGQVVAEKNFTESPDTEDRVGHGTHVASIAAGTGAGAGGAYKGVAPGAKLISGKVLGDGGFGSDSEILAGIEWAADQGAEVINLSLGGPDTPGVDAMEEAVNRLSADRGILFAIAAGNEGDGPSTVGSPGSADAALTVGAVDANDALARFSSRGPRVGDGAVKPDLTAPGVAIAAAAAPGSDIGTDPTLPHPAPGHVRISGTSMATPHVAGAAALLKQKNPGWAAAELKGALTASTKDGGYAVQQQGTGRVRVDRALNQTVITEQPSLSLGTARWPHTDAAPLTKSLAYRNLGTTEVTLDLAVTGTDPGGKPAPTGFFTLGTDKVTIPAGGRVEVDVTADTRRGAVDGAHHGYVTATVAGAGADAEGPTVRSGVTATREGEAYDVTFETLDRDGEPAAYFDHALTGLTGADKGRRAVLTDRSSSRTLRVPKGDYLLEGIVFQYLPDVGENIDWLTRPRLTVTGNTTVTLDARTTKPVNITAPGSTAPEYLQTNFRLTTGGADLRSGWGLLDQTTLRTAHLGPAVTDGSLAQTWSAHFRQGADTSTTVAFGGRVERLDTGRVRHVKETELAALRVRSGSPAPGKATSIGVYPEIAGIADHITNLSAPQDAPATHTLKVTAGDGVVWRTLARQHGAPDADGYREVETEQWALDARRVTAGRVHEETVNTGVFGPVLGQGHGVVRTAPDPGTGRQTILGAVPLFGDGAGRAGSSLVTKAVTTLYRDGVEIAENEDPLSGRIPFTVDAADAAYRLTTSVERPAALSALSTRVETSFAFRSGQVAADTALPVSTVRFHAPVDLAGRAPAGKPTRIPVTVQGAAAGGNLKALTVSVSTDDGATWRTVPVVGDAFHVRNPAKDRGISLQATVTDKRGNVSEVTVHNAYLGG